MSWNLLRGKLNRDMVWSMGGLAIFAVAGFCLNALIGRFYGAAALGLFNLVLALYLILAQVCVGGMYFSVLRYASEYAEDKEALGEILVNALVVALGVSLVICGGVFVLRHSIGGFFASPDLALGLLCILPGLVVFALNKIYAALVNSMRHMRFLALVTALRGGLIVSFAYAFYRADLAASLLPLALSGAEVVLFLLFTAFVFGPAGVPISRFGRAWLDRHLRFGWRVFLSGFLIDVNPRIDLLMLAYFSGDRAVGIYSMAAMIAEGLYQLPVVVQLNINPIIARLGVVGQLSELRRMVWRANVLLVPAMLVVISILALGYEELILFLTDDFAFVEGQLSCGILGLGIALSSGYIAFSMLLSQCGYPGRYTAFLGLHVCTNIALNALLIPLLGMEGAAVASSVALLLSILYLKLFTWRTLKVWV